MAHIRFPRESYIPKGAMKIADKHSDAAAYVKQEQGGKFHLVAFSGKADKPALNWTVRKAESVERYITEFFKNRRERMAYKAKRQDERKAFAHNCQVGDIYRTSWGYDQTNVEFFEVVGVKGKYAILREIASASVDDGQGSERCVPQSGAFLEPRYQGDERGQPIRRLIQDGHIKICDVRSAWPWGKRVAGVVIGEPAHRTASGWGH